MVDAGGTVATNTPAQFDKNEVLDLVNDSLGFLDRIFTDQGLVVLEANAVTNGVKAFLGEQWDTSRIGKWLQYTDDLAQRLGALARTARALAHHAGQPDQNRFMTQVGDYRVLMNLPQGVYDRVERLVSDRSSVSLAVKSLVTLDRGKKELLFTPFNSVDDDDLDRVFRPVVQVVKDGHGQAWVDDDLGDEGGHDDDDDEPGFTDEIYAKRLALITDAFINWVDEYGFDHDLWNNKTWDNQMTDHVFNGEILQFSDENQETQWAFYKVMFLADGLRQMILHRGAEITQLRARLDGARRQAKAAENKSAILQAQLDECNAARSQHGQRKGQTTQQTQKESQLEKEVRDLRRDLDAEKKKHKNTQQKYEECMKSRKKAASERAGDGNANANGDEEEEDDDENDEPLCQKKLLEVSARLEQVQKQSQQVIELQDETRKKAKEAEAAKENLRRRLDKEIRKNAKLEDELETSKKTTTANDSATADSETLTAALAQAKQERDEFKKKAKDAEERLAKAQDAAISQADSEAIKKLNKDRADFKARYEAAEKRLDDVQTKEKKSTKAAAIALNKAKKAERAERAAKAKAAQDATALQTCQKALAEAQKKTTGGDNSENDGESDDEEGLLSQGTFYLTKPRQTGATHNGPLRVVLKSDLIPSNESASDGWDTKLGDAHPTGTVNIVKNANGDSVLKIKARFEPKEGDKQRTEKQDNGEKPGDGGKRGKRPAQNGTDGEGRTGKKQKKGATTGTRGRNRGRGGGAAGRGGRSGKGKQKATNTEERNEEEDGVDGDDDDDDYESNN